jgi:hypothetical protein
MADFAQTYTAPSGSPQFYYDISYSEVGRASGTATYSVTVTARMASSSSVFGYYLDGTVSIGTASQTIRFKESSPSWTGTAGHSFTFTLTPTGVGDNGGTIAARFQATSNSSSSGKIDTGGDETVTCSVRNTRPYWSNGVVYVSPSGTIPENTSSLSISWTAANDDEGNTRYYTVKRYVNGSYNATIVTNTTSTSCTDNIGGGNQGVTYTYSVECNDGDLGATSSLASSPVIKNVFHASSVSTDSSIGYSTGSISFNIGGCSNSNGNTSFGYSLSCSQVTVYNGGSSPSNVAIWNGSGTAPSGTYIKFSDIKSVTSGSNYTGTFTFTLSSWNAYGSGGSANCTMWIDLRTNPSTISSLSLSGTYSIGGTSYYIPNRKAISVSWGASSDYLGGSIVYDVQYQLNGGGFSTIKSGLTTASTSFTLSAVSGRTTCVIRIIARTTFGYTVSKDSSTITLDYYNPPTVGFNSIVRNQTDTTISGTIYINTSIPSMTVTTLSYTGKTSGSLTLAKTFSKQETGLVDTDTYTFSVTVQDSAGAIIGTSSTVANIIIPKYTPMVSIRELGVGINAYADSNNKFIVGGNATITNDLTVSGNLYVTGASKNIILNNNYGIQGKDTNGTAQYILFMNASNYVNVGYNNRQVVIDCDNPTVRGGYKIYHSGNDGNGSGLDADSVDTLHASSIMRSTNANGFDGLNGPNAGTSNWIRTTSNGLLPYQSGGSSALGTSSWPFSNIYANAFYEGGTILSNIYAQLSDFSSSAALNGFAKLSNGIMFSWGRVNTAPESNTWNYYNFANPFPNNSYNTFASVNYTGNYGYFPVVQSTSKSQFRIWQPTIEGNNGQVIEIVYFAIGN